MTRDTIGDRTHVGLAKVRYAQDGNVEARLKMRNLAPSQLHRALLHQEGDPRDPGCCWFEDMYCFTTDSKGRIDITLAERAVPWSVGMFVTVYAASVATDLEALSTYPIYGTEVVYRPE